MTVALEMRIKVSGGPEAKQEFDQTRQAGESAAKSVASVTKSTEAAKIKEQKESAAARIREQKSMHAASINALRSAQLAEAALITDGSKRQMAIERQKHLHTLEDLKGNHVAIEAEIRRHNAVVAKARLDEAKPGIAQSFSGGLKQGVGLQGGVAGVALMAGGALGATAALSGMVGAMHSSVEAANQMNAATKSFKFATGSIKAGAEEMEFAIAKSKELGLAIFETTPQYARLTAAARGTKLAGEGVRELFTGVAEATAALNLNSEQSSGVLVALEQILSKGTLSSEELRQQIGEKLPGAFRIAAEAEGVTVEQLGKMLERGEILSEEFLPKFAKAMRQTYGVDAVNASTEARASIQRFHDEIKLDGAAVGEAAIRIYGRIAELLYGISEASKNADKNQTQFFLNQYAGVNPGLVNQLTSEAAALDKKKKALEELAPIQAEEARKTADLNTAQKTALAEMIKADEDAAKARVELQEQFERAKIAVTKEGFEQERAIADLEMKKALTKANGYYENELLIRKTHKLKMQGIAQREKIESDKSLENAQTISFGDLKGPKAAKSINDEAIQADAQIDQIRANLKLEGIRDAHLREQEEAQAHYEKLRGIVNQYTLDEAKQKKALSEIDKAEGQKRIELDDRETLRRVNNAHTMVTGVLSAWAMLFAQSKKNALLLKTLAIAQIGMDTAVAVMQVWADRNIGNTYLKFGLSAAIAAQGIAQALKVSQQKFADGGIVGGTSYTGDRVPAWLNSGEMVLNQSQQARLFEIAQGRSNSTSNSKVINNYEITWSPVMPQSMTRTPDPTWEQMRRVLEYNKVEFAGMLGDLIKKGY